MTVTHIVLFQFKPTVNLETVQDVCNRMLSLKQDCIHPTTQKPYILENSGGKDHSSEGHQGGFTHGFVSHFSSEEDRDYYISKDPAHQAFVKSLDGLVENVRVIDYTPGKF